MNAEEREKFYDEEIAPVLLELAKKCLENGLSMLASVEWDPTKPDDGGWGKTMALQRGKDLGLPIVMQAAAMDAGRNVDAMMMGIRRHCRTYGIDTSQVSHFYPFSIPRETWEALCDDGQAAAPHKKGEGREEL